MIFDNRSVIDGQEDLYVEFLIAKSIHNGRFHNQEEIASEMEEEYGIDQDTTIQVLKKVADADINQCYYLQDKYNDCLTSYTTYKQRYNRLLYDDNATSILISDFNSLKHKHFSYVLPNAFLYRVLAVLFSNNQNEMEFAYYYTYLNFSSNSYALEAALFHLLEYNRDMTIPGFSRHERFNEFMSFFDLHTITQISDIHVSVLLCLFNIYAEEIIKHLKFEYFDFVEDVSPLLKNVYQKLDQKRSMEILVRRYGYGGRAKETLQSIGDDFDISRERVRQIDVGAEKKIESSLRKHRYRLKTCAEFMLYKDKTKHISFTRLYSYFNDYGNIFAVALKKLFPAIFNLDEKYNAIFLNDFDKGEYINQLHDRLPMLIPKSELQKVAEKHLGENDIDFIPEILNRHYKEKKDVYKKYRVRTSSLLLQLIDEEFPLGYHISNPRHLNYLRNLFEQRYPELTDESIKERKVITALSNYDYRLVDKGTYVNALYIPKLDTSLIENIKQYLNETGISYYKTIHEKFKYDLKRLGIENDYQLKGAIDTHLEDEFYVKRDFVTKREGTTIKQSMRKVLQSSGGVMEEEQLKKAINKNSLESLRISLNNFENLFRLPNGKVVDKKIYDFTENDRNEIIRIIEALINANPIPCTTSNQVYVYLKFNNRKLLENLEVVDNHKDLMKIIKEYMELKYYFGQKVISKQPDIASEKSAIGAFLEDKETFTKSELDTFLSKMHFVGLNSFLRFSEQISDRFVQIEQEKFVRKNILDSQIDNKTVKDFQDFLDYALKQKNAINTKTFKGYRLLPRMPFRWNRYSLVGIVRSYFKNKYIVELTHSDYRKSEYIIKKEM